MAGDIFLTFTDTVQLGDYDQSAAAQLPGLDELIVVLKWDWGIHSRKADDAEKAMQAGKSGGGGAAPAAGGDGKKQDGDGWDMSFSKVISRSSPLLMRVLLNGYKIQSATLKMRKSTGRTDASGELAPVEYVVLTLSNITINSIKQETTDDGVIPTNETIKLGFDSVTFQYTQIDPQGVPMAPVVQSWSFQDNSSEQSQAQSQSTQAPALDAATPHAAIEPPNPGANVADFQRPAQVLKRIPGATAWEIQPRAAAARPMIQENSHAFITTPIKDQGKEAFILKSCSGIEEMGRLFSFDLVLISQKHDINFDDIIGKNVTITMKVGDGQQRFFNGHLSRFFQSAPVQRYPCYHATLVPWLWFLTLHEDCRIYQKKSVPEIIESVFRAHGFTGDVYQNALKQTYDKWENCVQYCETDFNFISRLMEVEGIYYFFKHEKDKHILVLADSPTNHDDPAPVTGFQEIAYRPPGSHSGTGNVWDWVMDQQIRTGGYTHADFDFQKPSTPLFHREAGTQTDSMQLEVFEYPGLHMNDGEGMTAASAERYAKIRREEMLARSQVAYGHADARGIFTGCKFKLKQFPRADQNGQYLVWSATHTLELEAFSQGVQSAGKKGPYTCFFHAIDAATQFRPARKTKKPVVKGPQTAIVVGPPNEEIYTDEYGRVKVRFHWDLHDKDGDDNPIQDPDRSCWVRVSQTWAGKNWGAVNTPRIGQEVIVDFLEGDPDRPIITGRVYNKESMPPYALPANKTVSTLKSLSSKGGGGFNEIRFEDNKGSEQVFIHGEKNLDVRVKNDAFETVGNNQHTDVKKDQFAHVENNRNETVDADHMEKIGKDRHLNVVGKEAKAVGGSQSLSVTGDVIEVFKGNHSEQVTKDYYLKGDNIVIEGMTNVTIKVGQSYIAIDATGISIGTTGSPGTLDLKSLGPMSLQATAPLSLQSQAQAAVQAPQVAVTGSAAVAVTGGMVSIN